MVLVLVDELDLAAARAIQYARTLTPDELRAVHFDLDPIRTEDLAAAWSRLGPVPGHRSRSESCRTGGSTAPCSSWSPASCSDGDTEVTVLVPRIEYTRAWHRLLHDRTADSIAETLTDLPHCNVTIVPYHLRAGASKRHFELLPPVPTAPGTTNGQRAKPGRAAAATPAVPHVAGSTPIAEVQARRKAQVTGRVVAVRVQPWGGAATLEATLSDGTGQVTIVFLGRRHVGGVKPGALMTAEGVLGTHGNRVAMLNPIYEFLPQPPDGTDL